MAKLRKLSNPPALLAPLHGLHATNESTVTVISVPLRGSFGDRCRPSRHQAESQVTFRNLICRERVAYSLLAVTQTRNQDLLSGSARAVQRLPTSAAMLTAKHPSIPTPASSAERDLADHCWLISWSQHSARPRVAGAGQVQDALPAVVDPVPDLPEEPDVLFVLGRAARVLARDVTVRGLQHIRINVSPHGQLQDTRRCGRHSCRYAEPWAAQLSKESTSTASCKHRAQGQRHCNE